MTHLTMKRDMTQLKDRVIYIALNGHVLRSHFPGQALNKHMKEQRLKPARTFNCTQGLYMTEQDTSGTRSEEQQGQNRTDIPINTYV